MTVLRERFGLGMLVSLLCGAFAIKAILLVDATSLWCDELYSVGKSFQPSFIRLLEMLRNDTHPHQKQSNILLMSCSLTVSKGSLP